MLRPRALAVLVTAVLSLPALAACGSNDAKATATPSKAATDCRKQWQKLGDDIASQAALTQPSALPQRWNTVVATIDYYSTSATGKSCGDQIDEQQQAIAALKAWNAKLVGFDMEAQLALVKDDATTYAAGPWPPAPSPTATPGAKKHKKKQPKPARPPKPAVVAAALQTLTTQAPLATQQQGPGWEQASVVDLGDTAATAKAVKDLQFLSTESSGWRASQAALATIRVALAAKTG